MRISKWTSLKRLIEQVSRRWLAQLKFNRSGSYLHLIFQSVYNIFDLRIQDTFICYFRTYRVHMRRRLIDKIDPQWRRLIFIFKLAQIVIADCYLVPLKRILIDFAALEFNWALNYSNFLGKCRRVRFLLSFCNVFSNRVSLTLSRWRTFRGSLVFFSNAMKLV